MTEIVKVSRDNPEAEVIVRAAEMIRKGEVVAIPTDTFYGLAANPFDEAAVERVFAIKGRAKHMPLLLLVDSMEMARKLAGSMPRGFEQLAERFWPGPLTIVVEASASIPLNVTGETGRIGLRLPAAAVPVAIVRQAGVPITGTSANRAGEKECSKAREVEKALGGAITLIVDGDHGDGDHEDGGGEGASDDALSRTPKASTVIGVREDSWEVLREGAIAVKEIAAVLGRQRAG
jgi:tRNA threonylcarbamoyl adenosine modification protein (Sua5/YciO/YrdC/YwlC family)